MTTETATLCEAGEWATFFLAGEMFALRVAEVQEVLMMQPLTPVPLAPSHIVGLLNLRGQIMPAIDLRRLLGFPARDDRREGNLLVLNSEGRHVSVLVDDIGDVLALEGSAWRQAPDTLASKHRHHVFGICPIDGHMVLGLRVATIAADDEHAVGGF